MIFPLSLIFDDKKKGFGKEYVKLVIQPTYISLADYEKFIKKKIDPVSLSKVYPNSVPVIGETSFSRRVSVFYVKKSFLESKVMRSLQETSSIHIHESNNVLAVEIYMCILKRVAKILGTIKGYEVGLPMCPGCGTYLNLLEEHCSACDYHLYEEALTEKEVQKLCLDIDKYTDEQLAEEKNLRKLIEKHPRAFERLEEGHPYLLEDLEVEDDSDDW